MEQPSYARGKPEVCLFKTHRKGMKRFLGFTTFDFNSLTVALTFFSFMWLTCDFLEESWAIALWICAEGYHRFLASLASLVQL